MELAGDEEWVIRQFDDLDELAIWGETGEDHAVVGEDFTEIVIEFVAMAVAFANFFAAVKLTSKGPLHESAWILTEALGAAHVFDVFLVEHEVDDVMWRLLVKFSRICIFPADDVAGKFHSSHLHAETDAHEWHLVFARILDSEDLSFDAALAKATRHENAVGSAEFFSKVIGCQRFSVDPVDMDLYIVIEAGVAQRFDDREIGVVQLHIFPDEGDAHALVDLCDAVNERLPFGHIGRTFFQLELAANNVVHALCLQVQRHGIR